MNAFSIDLGQAQLLASIVEAAIAGKHVRVFGEDGVLASGEALYIDNFDGPNVTEQSGLVIGGTGHHRNATVTVRIADITALLPA